MEYKIGDKVKVKENFWEIESSVYANDNKKKLAGRTLEVESVYDNGNARTKQDDSNDQTVWSWDKDWIELYIEPSKEITATVKRIQELKDILYVPPSGRMGSKGEELLRLELKMLELSLPPIHTEPRTEITWDTLKWKDVVVFGDGKERMVLVVSNDVVTLSESYDFEKISIIDHKKQLQNWGYTIKQTTPTIVEKLELTLDQIAEKFGVDVTNIKIKK